MRDNDLRCNGDRSGVVSHEWAMVHGRQVTGWLAEQLCLMEAVICFCGVNKGVPLVVYYGGGVISW